MSLKHTTLAELLLDVAEAMWLLRDLLRLLLLMLLGAARLLLLVLALLQPCVVLPLVLLLLLAVVLVLSPLRCPPLDDLALTPAPLGESLLLLLLLIERSTCVATPTLRSVFASVPSCCCCWPC